MKSRRITSLLQSETYNSPYNESFDGVKAEQTSARDFVGS